MKGNSPRLAAITAAIAITTFAALTLGPAAYAAEPSVTGSWIDGTEEGVQNPVALTWFIDPVPTTDGTSDAYPDGFHVTVTLSPGHAIDGQPQNITDQNGNAIDPSRYSVTPNPTGFVLDVTSLGIDERITATFNTYITDPSHLEYTTNLTYTDNAIVSGSASATVERTITPPSGND